MKTLLARCRYILILRYGIRANWVGGLSAPYSMYASSAGAATRRTTCMTHEMRSARTLQTPLAGRRYVPTSCWRGKEPREKMLLPRRRYIPTASVRAAYGCALFANTFVYRGADDAGNSKCGETSLARSRYVPTSHFWAGKNDDGHACASNRQSRRMRLTRHSRCSLQCDRIVSALYETTNGMRHSRDAQNNLAANSPCTHLYHPPDVARGTLIRPYFCLWGGVQCRCRSVNVAANKSKHRTHQVYEYNGPLTRQT